LSSLQLLAVFDRTLYICQFYVRGDHSWWLTFAILTRIVSNSDPPARKQNALQTLEAWEMDSLGSSRKVMCHDCIQEMVLKDSLPSLALIPSLQKIASGLSHRH
jgi:hypothetical protein